MRRIDTPKRAFTFTIGGSPKILTVADLPDHPHMQPIYENWLEAEKDYERDWRNYELTSTDWMLVADATFAGEPLANSERLSEVIAYRASLRDYNLSTDSRPAKPDWLK